MYYAKKDPSLGAFDPITAGLQLLTGVVGIGGNIYGASVAEDAQKAASESQMQQIYAQQRQQADLIKYQSQAQAQQNELDIQKEGRTEQVLLIAGVAGAAVLLTGIFIWNATKKK